MNIFSKLKKRVSTSNLQEPMKHPHIRDFIYLDIERVRSYVSQTYGGLPIQRVSNTETNETMNASISAGVPLTGNIKTDLTRYLLKSNAETKSLHDQIYDEFYQALFSSNSLRQISAATSWDKAAFPDGGFVIVNSVITITDYEYVSGLTERYQSIMKMMTQISSSGADPQQTKQAIANQKQIEKMPTKEIAGLVKEFYGNTIRMEFFPFRDQIDKILVGSAVKEFFRYTPRDLLDCYGPTIDAGWIAMLQVNRGDYSPNQVLVSNTATIIDKSIKQSAVAASQLLQTVHGINFPAVAVTPIAVYRETSLGS